MVAGIVAVAFPLLALSPINASFYIDWNNHLWQIAYYGEYSAEHHAMPMALNTYERALIAYPTFYGFLFYPFLGAFSSVLGPNLAIRFAILLLWIAKSLLVYQLALKISNDKRVGVALACLLCWEIYPLTNLYNRSALTEVFAAGLLTCSFCSALLTLAEPVFPKRLVYVLVTGLTLALAVTSHPITALYAVPFFGLMFLASLSLARQNNKKQYWTLAGSGFTICAFVVLVTLPWIYSTTHFTEEMRISSIDWRITPRDAGVPLFPDDIDNVFARFSLVPLDPRIPTYGLNVSTPFLDAQTNVPLLIFLIALIVAGWLRRRDNPNQVREKDPWGGKALFWMSVGLWCFATFLSLSEIPYRYLPAFVRLIQFPYRLITYQNLTAFAAVLALLMTPRFVVALKKVDLVVLTLCLTVSATAVSVKLNHAAAVMETLPEKQRYNLSQVTNRLFYHSPHTLPSTITPYDIRNYRERTTQS